MDGQMGEEWGLILMSMDKAKIKLYIPADLLETPKFLKICSKVQRLGHCELICLCGRGKK